jgi:group I intron endonuclease
MITKNDRRYCVYMLRFSATGEPFYIGKGLYDRPRKHYTLSSLKQESPKNFILNNFDTYITIEKDGLTNDEANAYEKELIALWGLENLTNRTRGGSGTDGFKHTAETIAKKSGENHPQFGKTGVKSHMYGKTLTPEVRAKISEKMSGEKNPMFGKNHTPEARAKQTGDKNHNYDTTVYTFQHKDGRIETCTKWELRTKYNLNSGNLGKVVSGKRKSAGGWRVVA